MSDLEARREESFPRSAITSESIDYSDAREAPRAGVTRAHPTMAIRWRPDDPTGFNVADVRPASGDSIGTCVVPMSHDYRLDAIMLRRLEILADATQHRVIGVDTPGITMNIDDPSHTQRTRVPFRVVVGAVIGSYNGLAELQLSAIESTTGVNVSASRIVGESLGAQLGASMAARVGSVVSLDLVEPVNAQRLSLRRLRDVQDALVGVETDRKADYIRRNASNGWGDITAFELTSVANSKIDRQLKALHRQGKYALAVAMGLRRGLPFALGRVAADVPVRAWRADRSLVCRHDDVIALECPATGPAAESIEVSASTAWPEGLGHHFLTDLCLMEKFSAALASRWSWLGPS